MALPTGPLPEWATDPSADITEPSDGKKEIGWTAEIPPHEYFNWLQFQTYDWLRYLYGVVSGDERVSWNLTNAGTNAELPALAVISLPEDAGAGNDWKIIWSAFAGADRSVALYVGAGALSDPMALVYNATWDTTTQTWSQDDAVKESLAFFLGTGGAYPGARVRFQAAGSPPWANWTTVGSLEINKLSTVGDIVSSSGQLLLNGGGIVAQGNISGAFDIGCAGNVVAGGDVVAIDDVICVDLQASGIATADDFFLSSGEVQYTAARTRTNVSLGLGSVWVDDPSHYVAQTSTLNGPCEFSVRIPLPVGATLTQVRCDFSGTLSGDVQIGVFSHGSASGTPNTLACLSTGGGYTSNVSAPFPAYGTFTYTPDQNGTPAIDRSLALVGNITATGLVARLFYSYTQPTPNYL